MVECQQIVLAHTLWQPGILIKHLIVQLAIHQHTGAQISLTTTDKIASMRGRVSISVMNFTVNWALFCGLDI